MDNKLYLQRRTEYFLSRAIDEELERIKQMKENFDIAPYCEEIGVLVALKSQAKELIDNL